VCQTCLLDLEYQIPVEVRDKILGTTSNTPKSGVNLEYYLQQHFDENEAKIDNPYKDKITPEAHNLLMQMKRASQPYYNRNLPKICSFWVKGECKRGEECPFRHEKPSDPDDPLAEQNIADRYHGKSDPVAKKLLNRLSENKTLTPPADQSITTLFFAKVPESAEQTDFTDKLYAYGEIRKVDICHGKNIAFVEFVNRIDAEKAMNAIYMNFQIKNDVVNVNWARKHPESNLESNQDQNNAMNVIPVPGLPLPLPVPPQFLNMDPNQFYFNNHMNFSTPFVMNMQPLACTQTNVFYPSQDPNQFGDSKESKNK